MITMANVFAETLRWIIKDAAIGNPWQGKDSATYTGRTRLLDDGRDVTTIGQMTRYRLHFAGHRCAPAESPILAAGSLTGRGESLHCCLFSGMIVASVPCQRRGKENVP